MSKKLDERSMTDELAGSAFFRPAPGQSPDKTSSDSSSDVLETRTPDMPFDAARTAPKSSTPVELIPEPRDPAVRSNQRSNERTIERATVRKKVRHTFDVLSDQLLSLREIAVQREATFGRHVLLGDLVQEARDSFIARERNKG